MHFATMRSVGQKIFGDESLLFFEYKHWGQAEGTLLAGISLEWPTAAERGFSQVYSFIISCVILLIAVNDGTKKVQAASVIS